MSDDFAIRRELIKPLLCYYARRLDCDGNPIPGEYVFVLSREKSPHEISAQEIIDEAQQYITDD